MSSAVVSSAPLPAGDILYANYDTGLICVPDGATTAQFQRVSFTGSQNASQASLHDPIDLGPLDDIRSVRAVTDWGGKQVAALLTKTGLSYIAMQDGVARLATVPAKFDDAVLVIGFDPVETHKRSMALLVSNGTGFAVAEVDMDSGQRGQQQLQLPPQVQGKAVAAELVRRGPRTLPDKTTLPASTMLVVATIAGDSLRVHAVAWDALAPQVDAKLVKTLELGPVNSDQAAAQVVRMQTGTSDQQLALAWHCPNRMVDFAMKYWGGNVALVGWGDEGEAKLLAIEVHLAHEDFYPSELPAYRLAAADLLHSGTEQLVLGYSSNNTLGNGYAGLMLFTLDESDKTALKLRCESKYAMVASADDIPPEDDWYPQRWDNERFVDLHIGAGLFGTCMGVQVTASRFNPPQCSVICGFVPVDPILKSFPAMPPPKPIRPPDTGGCAIQPAYRPPRDPAVLSNCVGPGGPGKPLASIGKKAARIFAFPCDLSGENIVLGPPAYANRSACAQILAILQAHPYDHREGAGASLPTVSFSTTSNETSGWSVSGDNSWTQSDDTSVNLGIGDLSLSQAVHKSYMNSVGQTEDTSLSKNVGFQSNFSERDWVLVYEVSYNIWRYPVVRASEKYKGPGEILVVFPEDSTQKLSWKMASDYAYRPRAEAGMLFSYLALDRARMKGYTKDKQLCTLTGYDVTDIDTAGAIYDISGTTANTHSTHLGILQSVSNHVGFTGSAELFECLPVSFGLNVGSSHSYSESHVSTTHFSLHKGLSLHVNSGTVTNSAYAYEVTPVVYQHDTLGCLMLAWEVSLVNGWKTVDPSFTSPELCLIRPQPHLKNPIHKQFSRSISFVEKEGSNDTTFVGDIVVEIFNNGLSSATDVACEFFDVSSKFTPEPDGIKQLTLPTLTLGKVPFPDEVKPLDRPSVTLSNKTLARPVYVAVQLSRAGAPGHVYWGTYPPENYFA